MGLRYTVLTSVCRDDLPDQGARHFASTIGAIKQRDPKMLVEALTPDFRGEHELIDEVARSGLDVFGEDIDILSVAWSPDGTKLAVGFPSSSQAPVTILEFDR